MDDQARQSLFRQAEDSYGGSFKSDLLEQYKLYVQSAENVSARRVASSRYLLTINAALVALYGVQSTNLGQSYFTLLVPTAGILVSWLWHQIIQSHRDLNSVKFKVIHELEQKLPAALYDYEWQLAKKGSSKTYRSVTGIELWIPRVFIGLHIVLAIAIVLANSGLIGWLQ